MQVDESAFEREERGSLTVVFSVESGKAKPLSLKKRISGYSLGPFKVGSVS